MVSVFLFFVCLFFCGGVEWGGGGGGGVDRFWVTPVRYCMNRALFWDLLLWLEIKMVLMFVC